MVTGPAIGRKPLGGPGRYTAHMSDIPLHDLSPPTVTCESCQAWCCRQEVLLFDDAGVPARYIEEDWTGTRMRRLDDGWCAALDREQMNCSIYEVRPWVCRIFDMAGPECLEERADMKRAMESGDF